MSRNNFVPGLQVGVLLCADLRQRVALAEVHKLDAGLKKINFLNISKILKPLLDLLTKTCYLEFQNNSKK